MKIIDYIMRKVSYKRKKKKKKRNEDQYNYSSRPKICTVQGEKLSGFWDFADFRVFKKKSLHLV